jgi:hypothetical protein
MIKWVSRIGNGVEGSETVFTGIEASSTCKMQIFLQWAVSKPFIGTILSIRRVEYDIEKEINVLSQSVLPRADWIANPSGRRAADAIA